MLPWWPVKAVALMSPAGYVVSLMKSSGSRGREGVTSVDEEDMRGVRDWRVKTSSPLTYRLFLCLSIVWTIKTSRVFRIGASTLHFRSHLLLATTLCCVAFLTLAYIALTGKTRSLIENSGGSRWQLQSRNWSYPHTGGKTVEGGGIR